MPRSVRSTSVHPVKRFSWFQVLSPWRSRTSLCMCTDDAPSREPCRWPELFLDAQQLVVFADAIGAAGRSGLDLSRGGPDRQVGDSRVLGLARSVRDDGRVTGIGRHADGVERLGDGADLVQL